MHRYFFTFILLFITSCSTNRYSINGDYAIYLEAPSTQVSVHCTPPDDEDMNSITYLYVVGAKRIDSFVYRRAWDYQDCVESRNAINKILQKAEHVRVAGMSGSRDEKFEAESDDRGIQVENPSSLPSFTWIFERIEGSGQCYGYFEQSCEDKKPMARFGENFAVEL